MHSRNLLNGIKFKNVKSNFENFTKFDESVIERDSRLVNSAPSLAS